MSDAQFEEYRRDVEARTFLPAGRRYRADHALGGLRLTGLDDLFDIEHAHIADEATPPERDRHRWKQTLAAAAILLRFHQLVERYAADPGLPRPMPLFAHVATIGGPREQDEFDFGTTATRLLQARSDRFDHAGVRLIRERRAAERDEAYLSDTRRIICELREKQQALALWPLWVNPLRRMLFSGFVRHDRKAARQAMKRMHGVDVDAARGEALYRIIAHARHPGEPEKALQPIEPAAFTDLHKVSIAYARRFGGKALVDRFAGHPEPPPGLFSGLLGG
jgi:hypothetical protein